MEDVGSVNILHAARHEAGHAVVGLLKGCVPTTIHVYQKDGRWLGKCGFPEVKICMQMKFSLRARLNSVDTRDAEKQIAASVAGALSQCRTIAEESFAGTARFLPEGNLDGFVDILLKENRQGEQVNAGTWEIGFESGGREVVGTMDGAWVSGADIGVVRAVVDSVIFCARQVVENSVRDVMRLLNDDTNWKAVKDLAHELIGQPLTGDPPTHLLEGDLLTKVIRQLGVREVEQGGDCD